MRSRLQRVNIHHHVKLRQNQPSSFWDTGHRKFSIFQDDANCLSAIIDLFWVHLDYPQMLIGGLYHRAKFDSDQSSSFDNKKVSIFGIFVFEMPIHAPKIVSWTIWIHKCGAVWTKLQKGTIVQVHIISDIKHENLSSGLTCIGVPKKGYK